MTNLWDPDPGIAPRMGFEVDTTKKVDHSLNPPKHSATLAFCHKISHVSFRSKVGNSLASVQAWKKAMSSVVHLQGVGVFFFFGKLTKKHRVRGPYTKWMFPTIVGKLPPNHAF